MWKGTGSVQGPKTLQFSLIELGVRDYSFQMLVFSYIFKAASLFVYFIFLM